MTVAGPTVVGERIEITGVVQGVGFRPFVARLATELGLVGWVGNDSTQVLIEVAGDPTTLDELARRLVAEAPPLATIEELARHRIGSVAAEGFVIAPSRTGCGDRTLVPPDTAVCDDCVAELFDPADRRFRHPFITCTNCGPRYTIIRDLPYDRAATTMAGFDLCPDCAEEYHDPTDRRHHAQPIACHRCGPELAFLRGKRGRTAGERAVTGARQALSEGRVVMVKGVGGFHLACAATDDGAVATLRRRKHRPDKPFAVMVSDLDAAHVLAHIDRSEAALLTSPARPIVLLRARGDTELSHQVTRGSPLIGVMLPYTPVHHLLLEEPSGPLVMTSANLAGEPIVHLDPDAATRSAALADALLTHDRPIVVPCDDSVVRVVGEQLLPVRRARGYAPLPVSLHRPRRRVLAVGGELKNTFCVTSHDHAWVSQHLGDMGNLATVEVFEASVNHLLTQFDLEPDVVAVDTHPGYATARWGRARHPERIVEVQHHHAHVAAVMAEHQLDPAEPVIGFAFDGTGYGTDGAIWGGEVLIARATDFRRHAHLAYVPLPGGDAAIAHPCRVALAHLWAAGIPWTDHQAPATQLDEIERGVLRRQLEREVACVPTSSMGRLFDAVASLLDLRHHITYEAQAAIDLEMAAVSTADQEPGYRFGVNGPIIDPTGVVTAVVADRAAGLPVPAIAARFHRGVADLVVTLAEGVRAEHGLSTVVLSGGVFQNALLTGMCVAGLRALDFEPLVHRLVPPNDGGLALGQAYVAAHRPSGPEGS